MFLLTKILICLLAEMLVFLLSDKLDLYDRKHADGFANRKTGVSYAGFSAKRYSVVSAGRMLVILVAEKLLFLMLAIMNDDISARGNAVFLKVSVAKDITARITVEG